MRLLRFLSAAVLACAAALALPAAAEPLIVEHVTLVDGTGRPPKPDMTVVMDGGRFVQVAPSAAATPPPGRRIDGRGRWLMPGLIDVHIHLTSGPEGAAARARRNAVLAALGGYLYAGVTTVYDAGADANHILGLRDDERAGRIASPRIFATGSLVTCPGGHGAQWAIEVDSWPAAKPALDRHIAEQKPDVVKLTYDEHGWGSRPMICLLPAPLMEEVVRHYNSAGVRTTVHTSSELRATEAIFAGVDSLAHPVIQGPISDEFVRLMAAKKTPMASTLTIGEGYSRLVEQPEFLHQPLYQAVLSPQEIATLRGERLAEWRARPWTWWMKLMTPIAQENLRKIHDAGGVIAVGSDQTSGAAVHREMELLQAAGFKPGDVVRAATLNGARHLGMEDRLGSIEEGKLADAVLVGADPTANVDNAKQILLVIKGGVPVDDAALPLAGGRRPPRLR